MSKVFLSLLFFIAQVCSPAYAVERILSADIIEGQNTVKNLLGSKGHFEKNALGWSGYDDTTATPVDGTGGTVTTTCTRTTSTPLAGSGSFLYTPAALGEGCSAPFTVETKDTGGTVLQVTFDYSVVSGTYTDDDTQIWIYDITAGAIIQPAPYKIKKHTLVSQPMQPIEFQTNAASTSFRILIHQATSGTAVLKFDNIVISKSPKGYGSPVTDWVAYSLTPTGSTSNPTKGTIVTDSAQWRRVGDTMEIKYNYRQNAAGGAGSGAYYLPLPSGHTIDLTKRTYGTTLGGNTTGVSGIFQATGGGANPLLLGTVQAASSTTLGVYFGTDAVATTYWGSGSSANFGATNFEFSILTSVPIVGWSSSVIMSSDANTNVITSRQYTTTHSNAYTMNNSYVKVTFDTTIFDTTGSFDAVTNKRYNVPTPGFYRITTRLRSASTNVLNSTYEVTIFKNGVFDTSIASDNPAASNPITLSGSSVLQLVAGDYIEIYLYGAGNNSSSAITLNSTNLYIEKLSGPAQIAASETVAALYTGAPPTGTLNSSYNTVTYGTKVKDSHNAYSSGSYTVQSSGQYDISASTNQAATYAAGNYVKLAVFVDGTEKYTNYSIAYGASGNLNVQVAVKSVPLLSGQVVTIRSLNQGTTPTFYSDATTNYFSIVRSGNF